MRIASTDGALNRLSNKIHKNAVEKGWWAEERQLPEIIALCHSELSEALEEYRNNKGVDEIYYKDKKPEGIPIELADCIIRILDFCSKYNIDIDEAIRIKMMYNTIRSYKHGNKKI